jgi:hypothetical protein
LALTAGAGGLLAMVLLPAPSAHATSPNATAAIKKWKAMDSCAVQAQTAFPDFTADSNAKRDAKLKECLAGQNLPPREPMSPPR